LLTRAALATTHTSAERSNGLRDSQRAHIEPGQVKCIQAKSWWAVLCSAHVISKSVLGWKGLKIFILVGAPLLVALSFLEPHSRIEIMKVEVQEYPNSRNSYDSLGELYAQAGEREQAIENYEKSIELNPNNRGGIQALKNLKQQ
jgi:tetratricopeptide (TPR) repeat protein